MKKFLFLTLMTAFLGTNAYAKHNGSCSGGYYKGGFNDMDTPPVSIADVQKLPEDSYVTMQGYITKRIGEDKYHFSDGTNEIMVEIDHKVWQGQTVSPKDKVVISGEIDKDDGHRLVDVKSLQMLPK